MNSELKENLICAKLHMFKNYTYGGSMNILDIFYNYILNEVVNGEINCFLTYRVLFNTYFKESDRLIKVNDKFTDLLIPTLVINNKELFDELLVTYVNLCLDYYDNSNFREEVINKEEYDITRNSKEKYIITTLFSNATYDDFANFENYLQKRIDFINNYRIDNFNTNYSSILKGYLNIKISKDKIYNETPLKMNIKCISDNEEYIFPKINFGISNDIVYIYAINREDYQENSYSKKVNRLLYKIGEGFNLYNFMKDVSPSFVVALNIALSYFHKLGYRKISVPSILITRYNSKKLLIDNKKSNNKEELMSNLDIIQKNLTDKFITTFLRIAYHYNLEVESLKNDSNVYVYLSDNLKSNNSLLNELNYLVEVDKTRHF